MHRLEPLVSVVIPTYNRAKYVTEAIESVLAQCYANIEVIVVNDGSKDDTIEKLSAFGDRIRLITQPNSGNSVARNRGISESRGELIAFLDDDDRWLPGKLTVQVPVFEDPAIGLVHTAARFFDESNGWNKVQFIGDVDFHGILGMKVLYGQTVVVRRSILDEVGLFADTVSNSSEDWDLWLRISANHAIKGLDVCTAEVRCHEAAVHANVERMYAGCMKVLKRHSDTHTGCALCNAAIQHSRRCLRVHAYEECKLRATRARQERRYVEALRLRLSAFRYDPMALALLPYRAIKVATGRIGRNGA